MPYERKFDWEEARRLRADEGMTYSALADRFGVSVQAISYVINEKDYERRRLYDRERQQRGICVDCGVRVSSNFVNPAKRCNSCAAKLKVKRDELGNLYCPSCEEWKPEESFYINRQRPVRGRSSECRACSNARRQQNRLQNLERSRAYDRERKRRQRAAA